ncbi:hypothetical protein [Synechococcus sp. UW140]|uniref:hypothetical protein n=1 Tax=Synechococcus sp. UW140 TaxID=368503 RepID=UPI000E0F3816|nr:hypothetical protein [Synechococcus sp. UW140]
MQFRSQTGRLFSVEEVIDLLVSLVATDSKAEAKWRGFYNSLSASELQDEWEECWGDKPSR